MDSPTNAQASKGPLPTTHPRVDRIHSLLGDKAVLLSWETGTKGGKKRWKDITLAQTQMPAYRSRLERGNIGVVLGARSAHLCTIDWDDDESMEAFLRANPKLADALRTRAQRGCNIWLRMVGDYPPNAFLTRNGADVGEWRADGNQTIISGTHPSGCPYTFVVERPPATIGFAEIIWPEGIDAPTLHQVQLPIGHSHTATQDTQSPRDTVPQATQPLRELTSTQDTHAALQPGRAFDLFEIDEYVPTRRGQGDRLLFAMARRMKRWERDTCRPATETELNDAFSRWWELSENHVDPIGGFEAYAGKWLRTYANVKYADDESPLGLAWEAAKRNPPPPETSLLGIGGKPLPADLKTLVSFLFELQRLHGQEPFYVTYRDAGKLMNVPHQTVYYWMEYLTREPLKILRKVSTGSQATRTANEYRYVPLSGDGEAVFRQ